MSLDIVVHSNIYLFCVCVCVCVCVCDVRASLRWPPLQTATRCSVCVITYLHWNRAEIYSHTFTTGTDVVGGGGIRDRGGRRNT